MKTLYLMRHGKSAWDNPELADHERPLAPRGVRAATRVARHLKRRGVRPDLIVCSTARRAADTADRVADELEVGVPVERERGLYLCGAPALVQRLRDLPDSAGMVLLVGHNPDLHDAALALVDESPLAANPTDFRALSAKFPTAACVALEFSVDRWRDIAPHAARLLEYIQPRKPD
ncbi:MAG TPA: histidine phosphatase family protein [Azospirillaceae bacterium]|nr:histidine phosphatase family protein [Azospirillaceae bacterium]